MSRLAIRALAGAIAAACAATPAGGQAGPSTTAHSGAFVVRLGADTVLIERFARTGDAYSVEQAFRSPQPRLFHTHVELTPTGDVASVFYMQHAIGAPMDAPLLASTRVSVHGDSATLVAARGDSTLSTRRIAVPRGTVVGLPQSYLAMELAAMRAVAAGRDSLQIHSLGPGGVRTHTVRRLGRDSILFVFDAFNTFRARIDGEGRILGMHAPGSTFQVTLARVPSADVTGQVARWAQAPATGAYSPADSVKATVGGATVAVHYGRPSKRGRVVFGDSGVAMEPWGRVWRTGANDATRLTTDRDLVIGGATVPAGSYTLWTRLDRDGWKLIVNRQTLRPDGSGRPLWGTMYDAQHDLVRVDMAMTRLPTPVEQMTIALEPGGHDALLLTIMWDTTQGSVPIRVK